MPVICDYHTHTPLCKHAVGDPVEYVKKASERGLKVLGFSDHCPLPLDFDTESRMDISRIEDYITMIEKAKNNPYGIEVLLGMEVDYVPGRMDEVNELINKYPFDYILGSIHHVDDFPFDHSDYIDRWNKPEQIHYIWNRYAEMLKEMVLNFKIDIIGHLDLPKKFKMYPLEMDSFLCKLAEVFSIAATKDISIEINTSGKRKPVGEFYPSPEILRLIRKSGCSITFGSDAHSPNDVASDFKEASALALETGFTQYALIERVGKKIKKDLCSIL